jgi:hypothetical protein
MVKRATRDLGCTLVFEPGRVIVGNAGILVTKGPIGTLAVSGAIKWRNHPSRSRRLIGRRFPFAGWRRSNGVLRLEKNGTDS